MEQESPEPAEPSNATTDGDGPLLRNLSANNPWGFPVPGGMALYARFRRPYGFDIGSRRFWLLLAVGFVLLTAYLVATRPALGHLAITTVPDPSCRVEVSGLCASNPIPWADVSIDSAGGPPVMAATSGADGRVVVDLSPGRYSVDPRAVGDLVGMLNAEAVVTAGQTTAVTVTYGRP
jgi:hypothetical protein